MKEPPPIEKFLALLEERTPRPLSLSEMVKMLGLARYDSKAIKHGLEEKVREGFLRRIGKTRYQWIRPFERQQTRKKPVEEKTRGEKKGGGTGPRIEGIYLRVRSGMGFVEVLGKNADEFRRDIMIPRDMEGPALHGDRVIVEIVRREGRTGRLVGRVTEIAGGPNLQIIGTLRYERGQWSLQPESEKLPVIAVEGENQPNAEAEGLMAIVELTRRAQPHRMPGGTLVEILGDPDNPEVQFRSIVIEHGIRHEFPPEVLAQAEKLPEDPPESDFAGRKDLRKLPFVTIDGETARDFDDAVQLEARENGTWRLRVAIADVSNYVRPGMPLDDEALERGTSVYFPDRAIPMLPERLSNGLCSLRPRRPRLVLVADMDLDAGGHRQDARFYRAVIESKARLTYTQVAAVLSDTVTPEIQKTRDELGELVPMLRDMQGLMKKLFANRVANGSLDLDLPEALLDLSEEGRAVGLRLSMRNDAHRMIEEFMLEANRAVAFFLQEKKVPFPYRIHEPPDPADVDELNEFLLPFGLSVDYEGDVRPEDIQQMLRDLAGHRLSRVLSRMVLRSLKQAQYTIRNAGHFGLAFPTYCHFTSPIRRYPDLLVHRQLGRVFDGKADEAQELSQEMEGASVQSSQREREAMEAERAMVDLKKAEFMLEHLLEPEEGTIVSVTAFGFFVELDAYPVEGLVRLDTLGEEHFHYDESQRALLSSRSRLRFGMGDRVLVQATNVSLRKRQIDFELLERLATALPPGSARFDRPQKVIRRSGGKPGRGQDRKPGRPDKKKRKEKIKKGNQRRKKR